MKQFAKRLLALGIEPLVKARLPRDAMIVLMYHNVSDREFDSNTLSVSALDAQLACLERLGFANASLAEISGWTAGQRPAGRFYGISFDDGRKAVVTEGLPVLRAHKVRSTLFIVSGFVGGPGRWFSSRKVPPSWITESEAQQRDGFLVSYADVDLLKTWLVSQEIGGHSVNHLHLTTLPENYLECEIKDCRQYLAQQFGAKDSGFAFPYGEFNSGVIERVKKEFSYSVTVEQAFIPRDKADRYAMPRLDPGRSVYELLIRLWTIRKSAR